jgi:3-phenylpropionate/trans-cinnamate dioxygenase ferredoxin subunit
MEETKVARVEDIPQGAGMRVDVGEDRIALFRIGEDVYAIGDRCSHAEASLAEGEIFDEAVECPRHGSEFDLRTGEPGSFPATRPVPVYVVDVVDGDVFVSREEMTV